MNLTCQHCGKTFQPKDVSPSHLRRNPPRFCSRDCAGHHRQDRVTLTCRQCGKQFVRKAYMKDWSQERGPFCGFACYGAWQRLHTQGEANPNFAPDAHTRSCWNWEQAKRAALERDGHRCVRCGKATRLHVHHLQSPDDHGLDNLVTLCGSCHRLAHPMAHGPDGRFLPR